MFFPIQYAMCPEAEPKTRSERQVVLKQRLKEDSVYQRIPGGADEMCLHSMDYERQQDFSGSHKRSWQQQQQRGSDHCCDYLKELKNMMLMIDDDGYLYIFFRLVGCSEEKLNKELCLLQTNYV